MLHDYSNSFSYSIALETEAFLNECALNLLISNICSCKTVFKHLAMTLYLTALKVKHDMKTFLESLHDYTSKITKYAQYKFFHCYSVQYQE